MSIVNYYTGKRASGTTLYDLKDSNNGTLEGITLPVINSNGYLSFSGGNGGTGGDYNRVVFSTRADFDYTYSDEFTVWTLNL